MSCAINENDDVNETPTPRFFAERAPRIPILDGTCTGSAAGCDARDQEEGVRNGMAVHVQLAAYLPAPVCSCFFLYSQCSCVVLY